MTSEFHDGPYRAERYGLAMVTTTNDAGSGLPGGSGCKARRKTTPSPGACSSKPVPILGWSSMKR
jgi:hypothetical protein